MMRPFFVRPALRHSAARFPLGLLSLAVPLVVLTGCASDLTVPRRVAVPVVDTAQPEGKLAHYKPHGWGLGTWVKFWEKGEVFVPATRTQPDSAIVYLYRPDSAWAASEAVPASLFLNGKRLPSLTNNHYYWVEMPAGTYRLAVRRPLPPLYFQKGTVVDFQVDAGQTYYLRYFEGRYLGQPNGAEALLSAYPLQQMPTEQGARDIVSTRLKNHPVVLQVE